MAAPPGSGVPREILFYDGSCGLCHALVRFAAARDRAAWFAFAPLNGETFHQMVPQPPVNLPDSVLLRTAGGALLLRSAAVLHLLRQLGGVWRALAALLGLLPQALLDAGYRAVARGRRRLFASPAQPCPVVPAALRSRFLP